MRTQELPNGKYKLFFETSTKIPIKTLFDNTTILIIGKFKGQQFCSIGYVVNVAYPGIKTEVLLDSDDAPIENEVEDEAEINDENDINSN